MSVLAVENLSAGYDGPAFEAVDFRVEPGEFVGLLGPNGTGKSTLLKAISGSIRPMKGRIELFGKPFERYRPQELARRMAMLPQQPPSDHEFSVLEVVQFGRHPYQQAFGWGQAEKDRRVVEEAMRALGVESWKDRRMGTLSGGEQQRVRLAQALAQEPELLLLDEPTAWADLSYQLELMRQVSELARARRLAVVAVLHDLNQASQFCSRLLLLHHGRLHKDGTPGEVLTEEAIAMAYGVPVHVRNHPETGAPYILPRMAINPGRRRNRTIHVVAGGASAQTLIPRLYAQGYDLTAGVLNALDSDLELATSLDVPTIAEAPFASISAESARLLRERLASADLVVVTGVGFGPGNLENLKAVAEAGRPTYLLGGPMDGRDFTGGEATRLFEQLIAAGAVVTDEATCVRWMASTGALS